MFEKVLLPLDDSEQSQRAIEKSIALYQAGFIKDIVIFNVYNTGKLDVTKLSYQEKLDTMRENSKTILETYQAQLEEFSIPSTIKRAGGDPASLILDLIDNDNGFDLIIMGSRQLNKFQELVLGSVTDRITRLVKIPVLIIK